MFEKTEPFNLCWDSIHASICGINSHNSSIRCISDKGFQMFKDVQISRTTRENVRGKPK